MARPVISLRIETKNIGIISCMGIKPDRIKIDDNTFFYLDNKVEIHFRLLDIENVYVIRESMLKNGRKKNSRVIIYSEEKSSIGLEKILILV